MPLLAALAAVMALVLLAGCGGPPSAPQTGTSAANQLVCQHYLKQRAWAKNLTYPTVADALKFEGYVTVDAAQSTGKLHADLTAMVADMRAGRSDYAASARVLADCTH